MDQFTKFSGGEGGNVIGLLSDTAHWKEFDEYLGEDLGFYAPPVLSDGVSETFVPVEGGIGYGVMKWTPDADVAFDLVRSLAGTEALESFARHSGAIAADTTIDAPDGGTPVVDAIVTSLPESKPLLHTALSAETLELLHRLSQQLINGDVAVDQALVQLAESDR